MDVLIIEHQREMRGYYEDFFRAEFKHFNCVFSNDGVEGFFKCNLKKYDLIILDHEMPRLNGMDLLVWLRFSSSFNQATPVLFISECVVDDKIQGIDFLENVVFFNKPFDFNFLADVLKSIRKI